MNAFGWVLGVLSWMGWYIVPFIVLMSVIVFVHELGHYLAGRLFSLRIDAFSLGFGPELFARYDSRGTKWRIGAFPIGGYVNFYGDANVASAGGNEEFRTLNADDRERTLTGAKLYKRAVVVAAGPLFNFVLAFVIFSGLYMAHGREVHLPRISKVETGSAADRAGFLSGDLILSVNGADVTSFEDLQQAVVESAGLPMAVVVDRNGAKVDLTPTPALTLIDQGVLGKRRMSHLGVAASRDPADARHVECGFAQCFVWGAGEVYGISRQTANYVVALFAGRESVDQVSGPIEVAHIAGEIAKVSPLDLFTLAGVFSVSVGLMNLLPIPLLDGGHLLFYAIEAVARRPLDKRAQEFALKIGIGFVAFLVLFTTTHDLWRWLGLSN
jgi:regulator of sigma E protease